MIESMNVVIEKTKTILQQELTSSRLIATIKRLNSKKEIPKGFRNLTPEEIKSLESSGNRSSDWGQVFVHPQFKSYFILNCFFSGTVVLGLIEGSISTPHGIDVPAGLFNSHIQDSFIGKAKIQNVTLLANYYIEDNTSILNIGTLIQKNKTSFSIGNRIHPGSESECRSVWVLEGLNIELADWFAHITPDIQPEVEKLMEAHKKHYLCKKGYIGSGSYVANTKSIIDTWIGPGSIVDGANRIVNSALLSSEKRPSQIKSSSMVEHCVLQECAQINTGAMITHTSLIEHSEVGEKAVVNQSIIGPNSHIYKGEVSSSLVGPFIGFHHQALLISTLWAVGKGNVAYGANIGSNHTSRKPDQEVVMGEGIFFGLGCHIKFPCNFKNSPHSLIATGVTLIPQKIELPFALITPPADYHFDIPVSYNEVIPGWMWGSNPYAIFRNMFKYRDRNKSRHAIPSTVFSVETAKTVLNAFSIFSKITIKRKVYTDLDIPQIGKNILAERQRARAVVAYEDFLYFFLLNQSMDAHFALQETKLIREIMEALSIQEPLNHYLKNNFKRIDNLMSRVYGSIGRDEERGQVIHDDYMDFHPPIKEFPDSDKVVQRLLVELNLWKKALEELKTVSQPVV